MQAKSDFATDSNSNYHTFYKHKSPVGHFHCLSSYHFQFKDNPTDWAQQQDAN